MFTMEREVYQRFMANLEKWNERYDPEVKMIRRPFHSPGYHTTLKGGYTHPTRDSLTYAVALLDSRTEEYRSRAEEIIEKLLSLQDTDPANKTYGIWSWFYEEPLEKMSPPDWNWADFCGKELLQVALDHSDRISPELYDKVKAGIYHASQSIIRRNMGPGYTNIAIMGTYVTLVAGQVLQDKEIWDYGKKRLKRIYEYTLYHGAFTEYNSPTYTVVALEDISRLYQHVKDAECRKMIKELNRIGWKCLASHFHPTTRQWAGPHSRCYASLQGNQFLSRIQIATEGKVHFLSDEKLESDIQWPRISLRCPFEFFPYFTDIRQERDIREVFFKGSGDQKPQAATSYLTPEYTLGSFHRSEMWNQRRALIGYFGDYRHPVCMHLRFLHDGYDYSSAYLHCVQSKNSLLGIVNFSTDGGDTHIGLDKIQNATIQVSDLRLRLEFTGSVDLLDCPEEWKEDHTIRSKIKNTCIDLCIPECSFGDSRIDYQVNREKNTIGIDVVLYQGTKKAVNFNELGEAVCVLAMQIHSAAQKTTPFPVNIAKAGKEKMGEGGNNGIGGDCIHAVWDSGNGDVLSIHAHRKPQTSKTLAESTGAINGVPVC